MATKINWKKVVLGAVSHIVHEAETEISAAVRAALSKENVHPSQLSVEQYDSLKEQTGKVLAALRG